MGKKMKFPSIFNINTSTYPPPPPPPPSSTSSRSSSSWVWPAAYCQQPKTLSFRNGHDPTMYKTINSAYSIADDVSSAAAAESRFTNSSESASFSTGTASVNESIGGGGGCGGDRVESSLETVIQGLRSERLFFQPGETSRSIFEEANYKPQQVIININENKDDDDDDDVVQNPIIKESVALTMESRNPYADFKKSMEEMVEANGLLLVVDDDDGNSSCSWDGLEELLCWYLRMNGRSNHGYIISAFVDLLVGNFANLSINNNNCNNNNNNNNMINHDDCGTNIITNYHPSPSSPLSFYTSSTSTSSKYSSDDSSSTPCCVSSLEAGEEIISTPQCFTLLESNEQ